MALADIVQPRICELGKIKIGGLGEARQKQGGSGTYRMPRKDDHFSITTLHRNSAGDLMIDANLMSELQQKFGDKDGKLRRIPIFVLSNDVEDIMQSRWVWYIGKAIAGWSDGVDVTWFADPDAAKPTRLAKPRIDKWYPELAEWKDERGNGRFKLHTTFNCVIGAAEGRWGGVYKFRTTSQISAAQLYGSLLHIQALTHGQLTGIPLQLVVRPMQVSPGGTVTTVHVVHVEIRGGDMLQIQQQAARSAKMRLQNAAAIRQVEAQYKQLLALPGSETDEAEIKSIVEEFAPEQAEAYTAPQQSDPLLNDEPGEIPNEPEADEAKEEKTPELDPAAKTWESFVEAAAEVAQARKIDPEFFDGAIKAIKMNSKVAARPTHAGHEFRSEWLGKFANGGKLGTDGTLS